MAISAQQIKELRATTGAGVSDVKKALEESGGDREKATQWLERKLGSLAGKREGRATGAGIVEAYVHSNNRIGVLAELFCETDFVARNPEFKALAHDITLHIAAMKPLYPSLDAVPKDVWDTEKSRFETEVNAMGKPANIAIEIVNGKLKAYFGAVALLSQSFVKDQDKTVGEIVNEAVGKFGENIKIGRFSRFEL
ncbi:MAG: elongation factor Ts [Candidatus Sungbacteria bacterium]|nr:elongation factor Ts [Candidatus Sungbacteria bacterium]